MASSNVCWGIEVGAGAIKALKLENAGETVRVLDFAIVPHKKVLSTPGLDPNDAIRVALGEFVSQFDLGKAGIVMSVPGHQAFARFAKLPPVEPKKVPDIVKFEAVQQIPFPIDQVEWDYQTFASPDSPEVEVGIFAITRDRVMEKLALYEDVDIVPDAITLSPVAAYNALAYDLAFTEQTPGTIILDIGTTSTDLVIAEAGRLWVRTFPIGGHHFTEAVVSAFQLSYPKAEKLKKEFESTKHARHVFQAMRPVFADLAQDVQRSIGYYQSLHKDAKLVRLIGVGSTFRLPGLRKFLKQQLQIDVYRLEQFKRLSLDGPRAGEFQAETLNLATAYGLALQGLGLAALSANLMPTPVVRTALWKRKVKWFGAAAGVAAAAAAAMFYRPFIDSTEVASNPVPGEVRAVLTRVGQLKGEAGDVLGAASADPQVAEYMGLLQKRDIYGRLVHDVGLMLADADAKAAAAGAAGTGGAKPASPAFTLTSLRTQFQGPPADGSAPPPGPDGSTPPAGPMVAVEMVVSTTQPDPQKFVISSLEAWLRQNAKREGLPYQFVVPSRPWVMSSSAAGQPAGGFGSGEAGGFSPPPRSAAGPMGGIRGGQLPDGRGSGWGQPPAGGEGSWGGPESGPGAAAAPVTDAEAAERLRRLAPLPTPPAATGSTSTFTVRWDVLLVPPEAPKPAEGGNP